MKKKADTGNTDRLVAFFFDIACIIYSLYYKKVDAGNIERKNASLRNVYYSTLKPFMLSSFSSIVGNTDEKIINKFISYYDAGSGFKDEGSKQTARLKALRTMAGGRRKTQKRKHRKYFKTIKRKHSNKQKYTRRK